MEVSALPGGMADGTTYDEAVENAQSIIAEWLKTATALDRLIFSDH